MYLVFICSFANKILSKLSIAIVLLPIIFFFLFRPFLANYFSRCCHLKLVLLPYLKWCNVASHNKKNVEQIKNLKYFVHMNEMTYNSCVSFVDKVRWEFFSFKKYKKKRSKWLSRKMWNLLPPSIYTTF